jgi:hypothetical protein
MTDHVHDWGARLDAARPAFAERCARRIIGPPRLTDPKDCERVIREEAEHLLPEIGLATDADAAREDHLDYAADVTIAELRRLTRDLGRD